MSSTERSDDATADHIMRIWLSEVIRRQAGENTGVRAYAWALSGLSSACHGAPILLTKRGAEACCFCRQPCESRSWSAPRASGANGDGLQTMHLRETRTVRRDLEQMRLVREADRFVHAAKLVEPSPNDMRHLDWRRRLFGWGLWMLCGKVRAMERITSVGLPLGGFSDSSLYTFRDEAREVVARRAKHAPEKLLAMLGGDRAA